MRGNGRIDPDPTGDPTDPSTRPDPPVGPKGNRDPQDPRAQDTSYTLAETGNPIPLAYGRTRVGAQLLERYPYSIGSQTNTWLPNVAYNVNDVVVSNGNVYACIAQGTSFPNSRYSAGSALRVAAGGGYAVNDTIDIALGIFDGGTQTQLKVTGISAGQITTVSVNVPGSYRLVPANPAGQAATSGGGSGATFNITWNAAGGPFGQGESIVGGFAGLRWKFLYPASVRAGGATPWLPSTAYAVGAVVSSVGNLYYCITAGTSSATGSLGNGPNGQSTDITDGVGGAAVHWSYVQPGFVIPCVLGICEGPIYGISGAWQDSSTMPSYTLIPHPGSFIQLDLGTSAGLTRPVWLPTPESLADVYANTALLSVVYLSNGGDGSVPNLSFDVAGLFCDATHQDVSACDIIIDALTHTRRGIAWPSARVDSASTGSGTASSYRNYCTAYGLNLGLLVDSQRTVLDIIATLLKSTNTDAVWTNRPDGLGGMLKFVPRADQALTANGVTFTPDLTATAIGQDDLLEPIRVARRRPADCLNSFPVEYTDRTHNYRRITVDDPDMVDVDRRGLMRAPTVSLDGVVMQPSSATMLSRIFAQRSVNVRNTYTLKLPWKYIRLEPTDLLSVTDPIMGLAAQPMRITAIDEQSAGDGSFTVTAEDFPSSVHVAAPVTPQLPGQGTFVPVQGTDVARVDVQPQQVAVMGVPDSSSTRGGNVDNIWPNPTSEVAPSDGSDSTRPEWAGRLNVGAGAFAGNYVRQLSAILNAQQIIGDDIVAGGAVSRPSYQSQLGYTVPCSPAELFYIEAQVRFTQGANTEPAGVGIYFLDANKKTLASGSGTGQVTCGASLPTGYSKATFTGTAPSGAQYVRFFIWANSDLGAVTAQFDAIYARRQIDANVLAQQSLQSGHFPLTHWFVKTWKLSCHVVFNGAGAVSGFQTNTNMGFNTVSLVHVGAEPKNRLRLNYNAIPNTAGNVTVSAHCSRVNEGIGTTPPFSEWAKLYIVGWDFNNRNIDFMLFGTDWGALYPGAVQPNDAGPLDWATYAQNHEWMIDLDFHTTLSWLF
jgi:hypothetical protein